MPLTTYDLMLPILDKTTTPRRVTDIVIKEIEIMFFFISFLFITSLPPDDTNIKKRIKIKTKSIYFCKQLQLFSKQNVLVIYTYIYSFSGLKKVEK